MTHKKQLSLFEEPKKEKYKFPPKQKEETVFRLKKILEKIEENIEKHPEHKKSASKDFQYDEIINQAKQQLKDNDVVKKLFKKYDVDLEELEYIPICFRPLEVSATTKSGIIYLNVGLLEDCDPDDMEKCVENISSYIVHETCHYLQQTHEPTFIGKNEDYLQNDEEIEGFQHQSEFIADTKGEKEAENYIDQVIDHHNVPEKEKKDKKDELLSIAFKYKIAGLFEPPPILLNKILSRAQIRFLAEVYKQNSKIPIESRTKNNIKLLEFLHRYDKFNNKNLTLQYDTKDEFIITKEDLKSWNIIDLNEINDFKLTLNLKMRFMHGDQKAFMNFDKKKMLSNIFIELLSKVLTTQQFNTDLAWLNESIKHEITHVSQYLFQHIKNLNETGGLSKKENIRKRKNKKYDQSGYLLTSEENESEESEEGDEEDGYDDYAFNNAEYDEPEDEDKLSHELIDVEFYPNLHNEVAVFKRNIEKLPKELHNLYFKYHVAFPISDEEFEKLNKYKIEETDLFQRLHNGNLGKWKKAVKEFYKAVKDKI
jgi:hypothetical protein